MPPFSFALFACVVIIFFLLYEYHELQQQLWHVSQWMRCQEELNVVMRKHVFELMNKVNELKTQSNENVS